MNVGSVGSVNFHNNAAAWIFLRRYKCKKFYHGTKAAVAYMGSPKGRGPALKACFLGDKNIEDESSGEESSRKGLKWVLTATGSVAECGTRN